MEVVSMSVGKEGKKKYLPLEIRLQIYDDVIKLRKQGLKYKEIQRKIYEKYGKQISLARIYLWIYKRQHPLRRVNKFHDKPSPKFIYIIGTILGDGFKYFDGKNYRFVLAVKDYEFAEEFGKNLAEIVGKKEPYKPFWNENKKLWIVEGCSILLYKFLDRPLEELKPYIEHCKECVSAFLRALFDGEGCAYISKEYYNRKIELYNTNLELLNYAKYLLKKYFNIDSTGPYLKEKSGKIIYIKGAFAQTNKDQYRLLIRTRSLLNFYKYIGFIIKRKQQILIEAIKQ